MTDSPTPSRYQWSYRGKGKLPDGSFGIVEVSFDFYRLCEILGIRGGPREHALKKTIRAGQSVKSLEQDIDEAIACLMRWKEMVTEDELSKDPAERIRIKAMKATSPFICRVCGGNAHKSGDKITCEECAFSENWPEFSSVFRNKATLQTIQARA